MWRSIDGKSLLIGGLLVLMVVCAMGGATIVDPQYYGRFSLVAQEGGHVYVIDTATGQVWQQTDPMHMPQAFYPASIEQDIVRWPTVDPNEAQP
jgi:hypothetical protein